MNIKMGSIQPGVREGPNWFLAGCLYGVSRCRLSRDQTGHITCAVLIFWLKIFLIAHKLIISMIFDFKNHNQKLLIFKKFYRTVWRLKNDLSDEPASTIIFISTAENFSKINKFLWMKFSDGSMVRMQWWAYLLMLAVYIIYLLIGAAVFQKLESPFEEKRCTDAKFWVKKSCSLILTKVEWHANGVKYCFCWPVVSVKTIKF